MPLAVYLAAGAIALAMPIVWWVVVSERSRAAGAHNLNVGLAPVVPPGQKTRGGEAEAGRAHPLVRRISAEARRLTPPSLVRSLERRVLFAGMPGGPALERVLLTKFVLGALGLAIGVLRLSSSPGTGRFLISLALGALGYFGPDLVLQSRGQRRQKAIGLALPDTLDQMTISVEAGLGFEAAMARAGRSGKGPLAQELLRTLQDIQAGMSRAEAMRRLADRTQVPELRHFVLVLIQADSYGLPIAQVLRVQARELRIKRRQRAEERAMKLPVKMLFPLIFFILPALLIVVIGPGAINISNNLLKR